MVFARVEARAAARRPAHRPLHARRRALRIDAVRRAFVERHHDVAAEQALDFHRAFGGEHVARAVQVALERHAFLALLGQRRQAHHLITAAVGQDRAVPAHEIVQAAEPRHALGARAQHQMIGVAENDVGAGPAHFGGTHRLDRRGGADGHEGGGADFAALHPDDARARGAVGRGDLKGESVGHGARLWRRARQKSREALKRAPPHSTVLPRPPSPFPWASLFRKSRRVLSSWPPKGPFRPRGTSLPPPRRYGGGSAPSSSGSA